uniref:Uncharacterized protein n=1 Tax=Psilocybe cubensis TaxID=181762 RepID=A0A8H7Y4F0_PSICU
MGDDATPGSTQKRKRVGRSQPNAEAGPSTPRQRIVASSPNFSPLPMSTPDAPVPTRAGRLSKPTMKKSAALKIPKRSGQATENRLSDSDSDGLPFGVMLPRHRVPKTDSSAKSTPKSKPKSRTTPPLPPKVKHLGSFEITSSSESDDQAPPRKKPKKSAKAASNSVEVIDLCSDDDIPPSKSRPQKPVLDKDAEVLVIESSDDDSPVVDISDSGMNVSSPVHDTPNAMARTDPEETSQIFPGDSATRSSGATLDELQRSYRELMMNSRPSRRANSQRTSIFSSSNFIRPRAIRLIDKDETVTSTNLHTPIYFRRTQDSIRQKSKMKAKRKKPKPLYSGSPMASPVLNTLPHPASTQAATVSERQLTASPKERATTNIIHDAINDLPLSPLTQAPPDIAEDMIITGVHVLEQSSPPSLIQAPKDSDVTTRPHVNNDMDIPMASPTRSAKVVKEKTTADIYPTDPPLATTTGSNIKYADKILHSRIPSSGVMIVDEETHLNESTSKEIDTDNFGTIDTIDETDTGHIPMSTHNTTASLTSATTTTTTTPSSPSTITTPPSAELSTLMQKLNYEDDDDFNLSDFELLYPDSE